MRIKTQITETSRTKNAYEIVSCFNATFLQYHLLRLERNLSYCKGPNLRISAKVYDS